MRFFLRIVAAVAVLGSASPSLAAGAETVLLEPRASEPPRITFGASSVHARDLGDGDEIAWLSVARELTPSSSKFVYRKELTPYDVVGGGVLELDRAIPEFSIWVAVNTKTGDFAVATPDGFPLREIPFPEAALFPGGPEHPDFISDTRETALLMLVRKNKGVWTYRIGDGTSRDADGRADGRISILLDALEPLGDSPPLQPAKFKPQDVVLVIDARRLLFYGARVQDVWPEVPQ